MPMQLRRSKTDPWVLPVTPAPDAAADLERKRQALTYRPRRGFVRDQQPKKGTP